MGIFSTIEETMDGKDAEIERLKQENEALRAAIEQAVLQSDHIRSMQGMADCMHMVRQELIEDGVVNESVPPMMMADAVLAEIQALRERIKALEDGLRPFARDAEQWGFVSGEHRPMFWQLAGKPDEAKFIVGDLRHAVALLDQS